MAIAIRVWIGVLIFITTYINFTIRGNLSVSIVSMVSVKGKHHVPECKSHGMPKDTSPNATTTPPPPLPDYGPRYNWDQMIQARILGSFFAGLIISSMVAGMVVESMGAYRAILWTHVVQLIFNTACVFATYEHYTLLMACRFVLGLAAGLVYPALQNLIGRWSPPQEKGKFISCLMGNNLGTCLAWPIIAILTTHYGWPWGFYFISIEIAFFLVLFYFLAADGPTDHPWITDAERNYIIDSQAGSVSKTKSMPPYKAIFKSVPFWGLVVLHTGNMWGLYLQMTGIPKFLAEVVGFDLKGSGFLAALPPLSRLFFGIGYGAIGDFLKRRNVSVKTTRKFFVIFSHLIPGVMLMTITFFGCNWRAVLALLVASLAINGAAVLTNLQNPQDLSPNFAGTLFGLADIFGSCTGVLTPAITGYLTKDNNGMKEWAMNFIVGGCIYAGSGLVFFCLGSVELQPWNEKKEAS